MNKLLLLTIITLDLVYYYLLFIITIIITYFVIINFSLFDYLTLLFIIELLLFLLCYSKPYFIMDK